MKKKLLLILALLCAVVQGAWATDYNVGNETDLKASIVDGANITITADITLSNCLEIGDGGSSTPTVTIDLNGKTLSRSLEAADADGHVIWVRTGSTLTVTDGSGDNSGKLTGGYANNGGGINNAGTLYFQGGTITDCKAQDCGGIYNAEGATLYFTGGTIQNCTSNQGGGGVNNHGTATISGGTISGNHATSRGGGVWNGSDATLTITGGTITGNRADTNGGGVFSYSNFSMSGNPKITGNENGNLYLNGSSTKINVTGSLSGANIKVTLQTRNRVITSGYNTYNSEVDPTTIFSPDYSGHRFFMEGNEVRHTTTSATATTVATEEQLNNAISNGSTEIQLLADIVLSNYVNISDSKTVTIDLNGYMLDRGLNERKDLGNVIRVQTSSTLTIKDSSGDNSGTIKGGYDSHGGAICNYGTVTFAGGTITSCTGSSYGGAVYVVNGGTFTMSGGVIDSCTGDDGGAIYIQEGGTFTMSGGTIKNCTSVNHSGGAINNHGTCTVSGGTITNNRADTNGGGVYTSKTISMSGKPYIKGNEGSNLYLDGSSKIQVTGSLSGAKVGVSQSNYDSDIFTSDYSKYNNSNANTVFSADVSGYYVYYGGADAIIYVNGYTYIECSWSGGNTDGHVVKTKKSLGNPDNVYGGGGSSNVTSLSGGWYLLNSTFTFNKRVTINGDVKFILANGCNAEFDKGIRIPSGSSLTIYAESDGDNMGYLWTNGSDGANGSIGANADEVGGSLTIHGGKIYAKPGSNNAAGIGGGNHKSGMQSITIYGGNITAEGKSSGAGIGGGQQNDVYCNVTIYGGTVTATGGDNAAGIGGGEDRGNGTVKIYGGTVTAKGNETGAGIGGGEGGSLYNPVYIYGGTVNATGGLKGAGIGAGSGCSQNAGIYIYGGNVTAKAGNYAAGIGGGNGGNGGTTEISGGTVNATGGMYAAGIGGGFSGNGGTLTISGGTVTATAGYEAAGIGGGYQGHVGTVTIDGGTVYAKGGGDDGTAIGKGFHGSDDSGTVNINNGHVELTAVFNTHFVTGTLNLGDQFMVINDGSKVGKDSRESTCKSKNENTDDVTIVVKSCDHSGASISQKDANYHTISCSYCKAGDEAHTYGSDGKCTKCNYSVPAENNTVTIYEANADGSGYDNGTVTNLTNGSNYTLPSCTSVPDKMEFLGWMPGAPANGEAVTWNVDEPLKAAGETIAVTDDIAFKARFRKIWYGSGTEGDPYQIDNDEDWNTLATNVSNGQSYSGTHFQLTNDISVSTMVGSSSTMFSGTFDGNGYTLIVSYTTSEQYTAPFRYVDGATIQNLKVAGTITPSAKFAGGIVARAMSTNTITNCVVDVTIDSQLSGDGTHGGIVANINNGTTTISGCVFKGSLLNSSTTGWGGFVGWTESNNSATVSIANSLFIPTTVEGTNGATNGATFARYRKSNSVTITDCYYTSTLGDAQGTQAYIVTSGTEGLTLDFGDATTTYEYDGIKAYSFGLLYQDVLYSGSGQSVTFTPESDKKISNVAASSGTLTGPSNGIYTLTMPAANVSITATLGSYDVTLYDTQNNTATIAANDDHIANVSINGRTLYQDGKWNTICLPFDMTIAGSPLAGATLKELDIENKWSIANNLWSIDNANGTYQTGLDGETLYLFFKDATEIEAGKPYIIKWASGTDIGSPIEFSNVEIEGAAPETVTSTDGKVSFIGNYDPVTLTGGDPSNLYLGVKDGKSALFYPAEGQDRTINSFRAYFHVDLSSGSQTSNGVRAFVLNFGDNDETTDIVDIEHGILNIEHSAGAGWYDLSGRKLAKKPTAKGIYIYNGVKRVIK